MKYLQHRQFLLQNTEHINHFAVNEIERTLQYDIQGVAGEKVGTQTCNCKLHGNLSYQGADNRNTFYDKVKRFISLYSVCPFIRRAGGDAHEFETKVDEYIILNPQQKWV